MTFFGRQGTRIVAILLLTASFTSRGQQVPGQSAASSTTTTTTQTPVSYLGPSNINYEETPGPNGGPSTSFTIQKNLNIQATRYYTFRFTPEADNGLNGSQKLPDGYYKLQMVLALQNVKILALGRAPTKDERYVTSAKKLVRYANGQIETDIALVFPDVTTLRTQLVLYTELIPIQQQSLNIQNGLVDLMNASVDVDTLPVVPGYKSIVTKNFFIPFLDSASHLTSADDAADDDEIADDLTGYINEVESHPIPPPPPPPGIPSCLAGQQVDENCYSSTQQLVYVPTSSNYLDNVLAYGAKALGQTPPNLNNTALTGLFDIANGTLQPLPGSFDPLVIRAICDSIVLAQNPRGGIFSAPYSAWLMQCQRYPETYLQFSKNVHVRHYAEQPVADATEDVESLMQVVSSVTAAKAQTLNLHYGFGAGTAVGAISAFGTQFLAGQLFNIDASVGLTETDYRSLSQNGTVQEYQTVRIIPYHVNVPATQYRVCLSVTMNRDYWNAGKPIKRGIYLCDDEKTQTANLPEIYYYVSQDIADHEAASPQALNLLLRGERDYGVFRGDVSQYLGTMRNDNKSVEQTMANAGKLFARYPTTPNGMISYPMLPASTLQMVVTGNTGQDQSMYERAKALISDSWSHLTK